LTITVVSGTAEQATYVFTLPRVNLGRCAEVRDTLSRLVRANHVAFVDVGTSNPSVSRRHAHIEFVEESRHYRIRDDRSALRHEPRAKRTDGRGPCRFERDPAGIR
jgi:hypothetical protein